MKIVLVIDQFDDSNNGTTVTARRFAGQLRRRGHEVVILAGGAPCEGKICAPVHRIPVFQKLIESQGMCFAKPDEEAYYTAFKDADIVHFYMPFRFCRRGEELARQMGIPTVAAFHVQPENITSSIFLGKNRRVNDFLYWWFYKVFYNRFDHIHCPSAFIARQLESHGYGAKLWVISNGVADAFRPAQVPRAPELEGRFTILMIGRLSGEKRQDLIIEAAKRSKYADRLQLVFAGKGPKEKAYRKLAAGLAHPPVFGFYGQDELRRLINMCDLYVHASDAEIEGISCMEALACGLVPVISDSPLSATGQFALCAESLFRAGDADDLARRIDYWVEHPEEKRAYAEQYALRQDENRVEACVARAEEMYASAIRDKRRKGYRKVPLSRWRRCTSPSCEAIRRNFCQGGTVRTLLFWLFTTLLSPILWLLDRLWLGARIEGRENLDAVQGGAVSIMNHVHPLDCTMAKVALFPYRLWFISLASNLQKPFTGWLIRFCGGVPLPDDIHGMAALERGMEARIRGGAFVHFYPEGMLVPYHEGLRAFHPGAFATAVRAGCPVVPMMLCRRPARGLWAWRKKPCFTLRIGAPLYADTSLPKKQAARDLQLRAEAAMLALERGETPPLAVGEPALEAE